MAFGYYGGWPAYVPVAERRKKAAREIARLKKAGQMVTPVVVEAGGTKVPETRDLCLTSRMANAARI